MIGALLLGGAPTFALTSSLLERSLWFAVPIGAYAAALVDGAKRVWPLAATGRPSRGDDPRSLS